MGDLAKLENKAELVIMQGDLSKLSSEERLAYIHKICDSLGLNPLTRPFDYISFDGKLILYARKDCTEQLRKIHGVSIEITEKSVIDDLYVVSAKATDKTGKFDESTGAVVIAGLKGIGKANAVMKAETKAKRRVTLSICGLGFLDESEIEDMIKAQDVKPVAAIEEPKSKLSDDQKTEFIKNYVAKFAKLNVSQADIERKFGVDSVFNLTGAQVALLKEFGNEIVKKGVNPGDIFAPEDLFPPDEGF